MGGCVETAWDEPTGAGDEAGFLAAPGMVGDWRRTVLIDAALRTGVLAELPAEPGELAQRCDLEPHGVRVLLAALREWEVVRAQDGRYHPGPGTPDEQAAAVISHHARAVDRWSGSLVDRLEGREPEADGQRSPQQRERWLQALGANARTRAAELVDRCLEAFPEAERVLDLAGGHGEYGLEFARRGCTVTLQDLPEVIEIVRRWPTVADSSLRLVPGDVFELLAQGPFDLVLCAGFTHTVPGQRVARLLRRLPSITAPGGGLALHTFVRDHRPTAPIFAVQMLLAANGGDTHGAEEYRRWLEAAGYDAPEIIDLDGRDLLLARRGSR